MPTFVLGYANHGTSRLCILERNGLAYLPTFSVLTKADAFRKFITAKKLEQGLTVLACSETKLAELRAVVADSQPAPEWVIDPGPEFFLAEPKESNGA